MGQSCHRTHAVTDETYPGLRTRFPRLLITKRIIMRSGDLEGVLRFIDGEREGSVGVDDYI